MKAALTLHFDSYWQAGSGGSGGADADEFFDRDADGLPCFRGKRLKGLIKDAAGLHQRYGQPAPLTVDEAFGVEGREGDLKERLLDVRNAIIAEPARTQLLNRKSELDGLSELLLSTAINDEGKNQGTAKNKTLRRIETAIPMTLQAIIECPDQVAALSGKPEVTPDKVFKWLNQVRRLLRHAGRHRHRGLGRCRTELVYPIDENGHGETGEMETSSRSERQEETPLCLTLRLTLKDAVIISASAASAGPQDTLDYLAGSALWGTASPWYAEWARSRAEWNKIQAVFHSGRVRFLPGLPEGADGKAMLPAPLSWHFKKGAKFSADGKLLRSDEVKLKSLCAASWDFENDSQPQQVRGGWFSSDGSYRVVQREHSSHTAIDQTKFDRAQDAQFFGYTAIAQGQSFISRIEADEDTPGWEDVVNFFRNKTELRIGRSKTTEYGRASVEVVADAAWTLRGRRAAAPPGQILLHAITDLALVDRHGQPTLTPDPSVFGLDASWMRDSEHTFTQVRSYSLWNRFRGAHDPERQVLKAGSVLAFKKCGQSPEAGPATAGSPQPVRVWTEHGLGLVAVNPDYLFDLPLSEPVPTGDTGAVESVLPPVPSPGGTDAHMVKVMHERFARRTLQHLALALGRKWAQRWLRQTWSSPGLALLFWANFHSLVCRPSWSPTLTHGATKRSTPTRSHGGARLS